MEINGFCEFSVSFLSLKTHFLTSELKKFSSISLNLYYSKECLSAHINPKLHFFVLFLYRLTP